MTASMARSVRIDTREPRGNGRLTIGVSGAGVLLTENLVLTSGGLLDSRSSDEVSVVHFGSDRPSGCDILWVADDLTRDTATPDASLIRVREQQPSPVDPNFRQYAFGRLIGAGPRECEIIFYSRRHNNPQRLRGHIDPGRFPRSSFYMFEASDRVSDDDLTGAYGAGVACDGVLIGIVTRLDPGTRSLRVTSMEKLLANNEIKRIVGAERDIKVGDLATPESIVVDALEGVSRADPTNIQQVAATQLALSNAYYENVLTQANMSFKAARAAAIVGLAFFLSAVVLAVATKQVTAPLVSAVGGSVVEVVAGLNFWLFGKTAVQLNSFHQRLERMQRYLVANSVASGLSEDHRDEALSQLIAAIVAIEAPQQGTTLST